MITRLLHNIGDIPNNPNYNTREQILACDEFLTFDGVYRNVYENQDVLAGKKGILFITGNFMGKDNSFDAPMPLEKFCTLKEVLELEEKYGFEVGWHSWSHRDLTKLTDEELEAELKPPFEMKTFAYPYGNFDMRVMAEVKRAGFEKAYSVIQGNNYQYSLRREYL